MQGAEHFLFGKLLTSPNKSVEAGRQIYAAWLRGMQSAPARPATHFRETRINHEDQEIAARISWLFANV